MSLNLMCMVSTLLGHPATDQVIISFIAGHHATVHVREAEDVVDIIFEGR